MSFLKINQLVVTRDGENVYSQEYHEGLNIIRGHNSTGKSTIANFIFFALGGEFTDWLPEAASCDYVIAEIEINGANITLKRSF
jgi:DNA repair exonuclease SbcCD ATPase subunit